MKTILKNRSLVILGIAESISGIGNWITALAIFALIVFRGEGTVADSSFIFLASFGPMLLVSPFAGWLADKFDRKPIMIWSELLSGLTVLALIFVDERVYVYTLLVILSTFGSLMTPARQSLVPALVAREDLTKANAFLQQLAGIIKIGGPFIGGLMLVVLAPHQAMIVDVISFGIGALLLTLLPSNARRAKEEESDVPSPGVANPAVEQPGTLMGVLRTSAQLRLLFLVVFVLVVTLMSFDVLASIFTRDVLKGDESFFGVLISTVGAGVVASTVLLMVRKGEQHHWRDIVWALLLLCFIPASLTAASMVTDQLAARLIVAVACFLGGLGSGLIEVQSGTLLQLLAPEQLLGRVSGLFQSVLVAGQMLSVFTVPFIVPAVLALGPFFGLDAAAILVLALYTGLRSQKNSQGGKVAHEREVSSASTVAVREG